MVQEIAKTSSHKRILIMMDEWDKVKFFYEIYYLGFSREELVEVLAITEAIIMTNRKQKDIGINFIEATAYLNFHIRTRLFHLDPKGLVFKRHGIKNVFDLITFGKVLLNAPHNRKNLR